MGAGEFIAKVPVPVCGLALALASLDGFLFSEYHHIYSVHVCMLLSAVILILFTIRMITDRKGIMKEMENPAVFGVLPTYTMTLMLLSAFAFEYIGVFATGLWLSAIAASYVLMFFFARKFVLRFEMSKVFPGWFVIFIGYIAASTTSPVFGMEQIGMVLLWSGIAGYAFTLPLIAYRTVVKRGTPEPLVPQAAIFAAPANLCIVACLAVYGALPPEAMVALLAVLGVICYVAVMAYMPVMLNRKFYPSYSALTFPLVISAVSFSRLGYFYGISEDPIYHFLLTASVLIAVIMVIYVTARYVMFFYGNAMSGKAVKQ